ncbi:MAG: PEP-CTERM sorting domain-containing protein, partial [Phycisphaerae bacterium]|nr:PEP-CTERM sorting domain-containing protein [Phycisphaerae bacterium]
SFHAAVFDKDAANFGLFPPPAADPWIGMFLLEIPLGVDINGNGENDKIKITLATISAGDGNRTFITLPDGTVINEFDAGSFIEGAVVDESTDPPFMIGARLPNGLPDPNAFGGPTTATSNLQNPVLPEPATVTILVVGGLAILRRRRRVA